MKIINYEFLISDAFGTKYNLIGAWAEDAEHDRKADGTKIYSQDEIEREINVALAENSDHEVLEIKTNFVTVHRHNNAGCDTIYEYVTIVLK